MTHKDEIRLLHFVDQELGQPFEWGFRDCNTLALRWLDTLAGTALAVPVLGKYQTEQGALRFQKKYKRLTGIFQDEGVVKIDKGFEQRGDILVVENDRWDMGHICLGVSVLTVGPDHDCRIWPATQLQSHDYSVWRMVCRSS